MRSWLIIAKCSKSARNKKSRRNTQKRVLLVRIALKKRLPFHRRELDERVLILSTQQYFSWNYICIVVVFIYIQHSPQRFDSQLGRYSGVLWYPLYAAATSSMSSIIISHISTANRNTSLYCCEKWTISASSTSSKHVIDQNHSRTSESAPGYRMTRGLFSYA